MSSFGLSQIVTEATRITNTSESLIDHVYTSSPEQINSFSIEAQLSTSDHQSIAFCINGLKKISSNQRRKVWLYSRVDFDDLNEDLFNSIDNFNISSDIETSWLDFQDIFMKKINSFIPSRSISCRKHLPWITNNILKLMRQRDKSYKVAK